MPFFKKSTTNEDVAGGGDASMFGLTRDQIKELMELRGKELIDQLNSSAYNGIDGILEKLCVDKNTGLDANNQQDLEQRHIAYGRNQIPHKSISHVPFTRAWRTERQFRHAREESEMSQQACVLRNNHSQYILASEVVVGDICIIKLGDLLPADGLLIQGNTLKIDEAELTGEADPKRKDEHEDVALFSGTVVVEGEGRMVAVRVGLNSEAGIIVALLGATSEYH